MNLVKSFELLKSLRSAFYFATISLIFNTV